ncbi:MAG: 2-C-methyl-D-erythritol 2,4-cyclodiphosphate synthase [Sediminibacterium sp.]|nr:2-C-methyl-D-erythritol 2,4-cyclodiphosphate synthase [Sediminibacterium sp.]
MKYRIGSGIDFHQLIENKPFFLGGILIPFHKGALAHSDGDVLLHAICDALLGAACLGDIGVHFPNSSKKFKNIDSKILLKETYILIKNNGFLIQNIDSTICLEEPKIQPFIKTMQQTIAEIVEINTEDISIKATTTEQLGSIGRKEGIMAMATCLLSK